MKKTEEEKYGLMKKLIKKYGPGGSETSEKIKVVCTREEGFNILEVKLLEE